MIKMIFMYLIYAMILMFLLVGRGQANEVSDYTFRIA